MGSVHTLNPVIEEQLVRQGYAEFVDEPKPKVETAVMAPARNTAKRTTKPKPREGSRKRTFSSPKE